MRNHNNLVQGWWILCQNPLPYSWQRKRGFLTAIVFELTRVNMKTQSFLTKKKKYSQPLSHPSWLGAGFGLLEGYHSMLLILLNLISNNIDIKMNNHSNTNLFLYRYSLAFPSRCTAWGVSWQAGNVKRSPTTRSNTSYSCRRHSNRVWLKVSWRRGKLP